MTTIKPTQRDKDWAKRWFGRTVYAVADLAQSVSHHAAAERAIGYRMGIEAAAKALEDDAQLCDCHARSEGECACGAWSDYKTVPMERAVDIVRAISGNAEAIAKGNQQ